MTRTSWALGLLGGLLVAAAGPAAVQDKKPVEIDGLKSAVPGTWKEEQTTSNMRVLQYRVPRAEGDAADAEFIVFYFGPGGGGGTEDNIKRWKGMFVAPEGKSIDDVSKVETFKAGNVPVTSLDVQGTYKFKKAPFIPDDKAELRPDYRMIAVIFESPKGPYYLRLVGPAKTVEQNKKAFEEMVKGFK
jgi:hypothetical protein